MIRAYFSVVKYDGKLFLNTVGIQLGLTDNCCLNLKADFQHLGDWRMAMGAGSRKVSPIAILHNLPASPRFDFTKKQPEQL